MTAFPTAIGKGGLQKLVVVAPDGARAEIYEHGAQLTSWIPAGGSERLYLSPRSEFGASLAIRGGVPIVFPQFSSQGPLPKHGFARTSRWEVVSLEPAQARLRLRDGDASRALWPPPFQLDFTVSIGGSRLRMELEVQNRGAAPFRFQAALHTYLAVGDIAAVAVAGLRGLRYDERAGGGSEPGTQVDPEVRFANELDRIYHGAPAEMAVREPGRTVRIRATGFPDTVVWNPGAELSARIPDLGPDEFRRMVCVEAAAVASPVELAPAASWKGSQTLTAG